MRAAATSLAVICWSAMAWASPTATPYNIHGVYPGLTKGQVVDRIGRPPTFTTMGKHGQLWIFVAPPAIYPSIGDGDVAVEFDKNDMVESVVGDELQLGSHLVATRGYTTESLCETLGPYEKRGMLDPGILGGIDVCQWHSLNIPVQRGPNGDDRALHFVLQSSQGATTDWPHCSDIYPARVSFDKEKHVLTLSPFYTTEEQHSSNSSSFAIGYLPGSARDEAQRHRYTVKYLSGDSSQEDWVLKDETLTMRQREQANP